MANPVSLWDKDGLLIKGESKADAENVVKEIREMFPGDEFSAFRDLIIQGGKRANGKQLANISIEELNNVFDGITLNDDQRALIEIVVNTINSSDEHFIEYVKRAELFSYSAEVVYYPLLEGRYKTIIEQHEGIPGWIVEAEGGGGITTRTKSGTYSIVLLDGVHPNGQIVDTGHEIFGHGRSLIFGKDQHIEVIRTENLILRVMGIPYLNHGESHGTGDIVSNPDQLPSYR